MKPLMTVGLLLGVFASSVATPASAAVELTVSELERAGATLTVVSEVTCDDGSEGTVDTTIVLNAFSETVRGTQPASERVQLDIQIIELSSCTGQLRHTTRLVDDPDYEQNRLNVADLAGTFEVTNAGVRIGTLTIDLELIGTGRTTRSNSSSNFVESDGTRILTVTEEARRSVSANGSVTLNGIEFAQGGSFGLSTIRTTELRIRR